jgi:hypothetical protein
METNSPAATIIIVEVVIVVVLGPLWWLSCFSPHAHTQNAIATITHAMHHKKVRILSTAHSSVSDIQGVKCHCHCCLSALHFFKKRMCCFCIVDYYAVHHVPRPLAFCTWTTQKSYVTFTSATLPQFTKAEMVVVVVVVAVGLL